MAQALRRTTTTDILTTGKRREEVVYAVTSMPCHQASAAELEAIWRGHWRIENRVHYVRDVAWGEDACQVAKGNAPHALAALRNGFLNQLRATGWSTIARALRHFAAHLTAPLRFLGL